MPLIGVAVDLRRDVLGTLRRGMVEHGDVVRFVAGPPGLRQTFHGVFHPDGVHRVLAANADAYRKENVAYQEVRWFVGDGLLTSQDERWQRQRRLLQPLFTRRRVAGYLGLMDEEARHMVSSAVAIAERNGSVDLHHAMTGLSLRVVLRALFGTDSDRVLPVVERVLPLLGRYALRRSVAPARVPHSWPTPANSRAWRARRALYDVCDELIQRRRLGERQGDDMLDVLLDAPADKPMTDLGPGHDDI